MPATRRAIAGATRAGQQVPGAGRARYAGVNGAPRANVNNDYHEWQPRAGFAYRLSPHTVFRGGFGRFIQADFITGSQSGFSRTTSLIASTTTASRLTIRWRTRSTAAFCSPWEIRSARLSNPTSFPTWYDPNLGRLYSLEGSAHLQHQWRGWLFEIGFSHNKTYGIWNFGTWYANEQPFSLWQQYQTPNLRRHRQARSHADLEHADNQSIQGDTRAGGTSLGQQRPP